MKEYYLLIISIFVTVLILITGFSTEGYVISPNEDLEVGVDIPEGVYDIESLDEDLDEYEEDDLLEDELNTIESEDEYSSDFLELDNSIDGAIKLNEGTVLSSYTDLKLIKVEDK